MRARKIAQAGPATVLPSETETGPKGQASSRTIPSHGGSIPPAPSPLNARAAAIYGYPPHGRLDERALASRAAGTSRGRTRAAPQPSERRPRGPGDGEGRSHWG